MISMASRWKWISGQGMKVHRVFMEIHSIPCLLLGVLKAPKFSQSYDFHVFLILTRKWTPEHGWKQWNQQVCWFGSSCTPLHVDDSVFCQLLKLIWRELIGLSTLCPWSQTGDLVKQGRSYSHDRL
jgi:hypothetical protein